jgi:hypothetical protein
MAAKIFGPPLEPDRGVVLIGIDPGINGGLAAASWPAGTWGPHTRSDPGALLFTPMPATERGVIGWLWGACGAGDAAGGYPSGGAQCRACLEAISPGHPGPGKVSTAKLYGGYRALRMALAALYVPYRACRTTGVWRTLGVPPRRPDETDNDWKGRLKLKASELFPQLLPTLKTADALLMLAYCCSLFGAGLPIRARPR